MSRRKRKTVYKNQNKDVFYSNKQEYKNDEKTFSNMVNSNVVYDRSAFNRLMLNDILSKSQLLETGYIGDFKFEDICDIIRNPKYQWQKLLAISETLMRISPHYYRLNIMLSNMALFNYTVDLFGVKDGYDITVLKKKYTSLIDKLEDMNLKDEFHKVMKYLPYQDLFCGLLVENRNESFIQPLNLKVIKLYRVQDGLYNFKINLSLIDSTKLSAYPDYVREEYEKYIGNMGVSQWYEPPSDKQICIKLNRQWIYPFPILISLARDIFDLNIYKKLKLQSARTDNYKAILAQVPIDENAIDKPLLSPDVLSIFADINRHSMNDDIGFLYTVGSKGEAISFKDSTNSRNNVSDSVNDIYDSSGVTKELFNGSSSATAVTYSVENVSAIIYSLYRQFERWMNRYIKAKRYNNSLFKFKFVLLDMTIFNRDTVQKRYKEATTLGATVIDKWLASMDMTPSTVLGSYILHNEVFDYHKNFIPLSSTYTSSDSQVGRPTAEENGETIGDSGEQTRDSDANNNR